MNFKTGAASIAVLLAAMGGAQAQTPSVAAAWGNANLSQQECLDRGVDVMKRLNYTRIEAIAFSVYGDFGKFQIAIRCVPEKQLYFVYGGGPGEDEKPLLTQINSVKREMDPK